VNHLARVDQLLHRAGDILDRHLGVDPVLVVQVDAVGAQPTQRVVDGTPDAVRPAAQTARFDPVLGEREAELRGDLHLVPHRFEGLADDFFVRERAVHFCGVEEGHTEVHRVPDQRDRVLPGWAAGIAVGAGEAHASQPDLGDGQAGAERSLLHGDSFRVLVLAERQAGVLEAVSLRLC
jgi:hypothetical protein